MPEEKVPPPDASGKRGIAARRLLFTAAILLAYEGAVAQLGEHLVCNQGVVGSNPIRSMLPYVGPH
jgi:hypothetical protein